MAGENEGVAAAANNSFSLNGLFNEKPLAQPPVEQAQPPATDDDAPASGNSATAASASPDTGAAKPPEEQPSEIDFAKITDGRFKSKDELTGLLSEYETLKKEKENFKPKDFDPEAEKYNDFIKAYPDKKQDYWKIVSRDFSTLSELDAIREEMKLNNTKGLSDEDIDLLLNDKFRPVRQPKKPVADVDGNIDPEEQADYNEALAEAERKQRLIDIQRKSEAFDAKQKLADLQSKYKVEPKDNSIQTQKQLEQQAELEKQVNAFNTSLSQLKSLEVEVVVDSKTNETFKLAFEPSQEDKQFLGKVFSGEQDALSEYGTDVEAFKKGEVFKRNMNKIIAIAYNQGKSAGVESLLKERTNPGASNGGDRSGQEAGDKIDTTLFR